MISHRASILILASVMAAAAASAQITITTPSPLPSAYDGFYYSYALSATSNPVDVSITWTLLSGALPPGLGVGTDGTVSGYPQQDDSGVYNFTVQASFTTGNNFVSTTKDFSMTAVVPQITITTPSPLPNAFYNQPYSIKLTADSNVPGTLDWFTESTPPGLTLSSDGTLSGTPTSYGTFEFVVYTGIDQAEFYVSQTFDLTEYAGKVIIQTSSLPLGTAGQSYSATLTAGLTGPPIRLDCGDCLNYSLGPPVNFVPQVYWTLNSDLPPGLNFDNNTGTFSGTPTVPGVYPISAEADYPYFLGGTVNLTLYVTNGPLTIQTSSLPDADLNKPYQAQIVGTGGLGAFTWAMSNNVGLNITSSNGVINGTPTMAGPTDVLVLLRDITGTQVSATLPLNVVAPVSITTTSLAGGGLDTGYNQPLAATGGTKPYSWSLAKGSVLPPGLMLSSSGAITGSPTAGGVFPFTVVVTDAGQRTATAMLSITVSAVGISTTSLPNDVINVDYSQTLAASGGVQPYTWTISSGSLPAGLTLDSSSGAITGKPAGPAGPANFTVTVTDSTPGTHLTAQKMFSINIAVGLTITTTSLPDGDFGSAYSQTVQASGGDMPYQWSIGSGALPAGLKLDASTGAITGTPTASGPFTITAVVKDSGGQSAQQQFSFTITAALSFAPPASYSATVGTAFSQSLTAGGGSPGYTFSVTSGTLPAGLSLNANSGAITGTPGSAGTSMVTFTVTDQHSHKQSAAVTFNVTLPSAPPVTFGFGNGTQPPVMLCLAGGFPVPVTGTLTLTFQPSSSVAVGTDSSVQFASPGTGSTVSFTLPPCGSVPPVSAIVTMGTVAGTITVTATLDAGGTDITPPDLGPQTIPVPAGPPVIQSVTLTQGNGIVTVTVVGYSSTREMTTGLFHFTASSGNTLSQSDVTVTLSSPFTTWYQNSSSNAFGGQFKLTIPFNVSGSSSSITGVTVTLTNTKGASAPLASQ